MGTELHLAFCLLFWSCLHLPLVNSFLNNLLHVVILDIFVLFGILNASAVETIHIEGVHVLVKAFGHCLH